MIRKWCLGALMCLALWAVAIGAAPDVPNTTAISSHAAEALADSPSSDGTSDRRVAAAPAVACPAASTWTSQGHHAVLARAQCHSLVAAPQAADAYAPPAPRALRPQIQTPLLI